MTYLRRREAVWRVGPGLLVAATPGGEAICADGPAPEIWERLAQPTDLDGLVSDLALLYDAPIDIVGADVASFIDRLDRAGLVEWCHDRRERPPAAETAEPQSVPR